MNWIFKYKFKIIPLIIIAVVASVMIKKRQTNGNSVTAPLKKGTVIESVYGIGTITAKKSYQVKITVNNTIRQLFVKEGDQVQKGQRLVIMDAGSFSAPFAGTVTYLPFKEGENVFANSVVLNLVDLQDRYLVVSLEQQGALRVHQGQKAKLSFDSIRNESYDGFVQSVYSNDNNFLVRIDVSDLPAQILPGMTADVAIGISEKKDVLLVPVAAIEDSKVYKKNNYGGTTAVDIKTGIVDGEMAEAISDDLHEGDVLIIKKKAGP